jgi:uncharacterized protein YdcH (DUF465 family)
MVIKMDHVKQNHVTDMQKMSQLEQEASKVQSLVDERKQLTQKISELEESHLKLVSDINGLQALKQENILLVA